LVNRIAFVGPLPPPVNGFSNICGMMLAIMKCSMSVDVFDRAPFAGGKFRTLSQQLTRPLRYLLSCLAHRRAGLYLALSGGNGQIIDLVYIIVGKLFRRSIYIHHHSFSYIGAPSSLNRLLFSLVRSDTHIVLSPKMGQMLSDIYGLNRANVVVLSNAAFYGAAESEPKKVPSSTQPVRIGYLSNITFEKGFVEFFGILKRLKGEGVAFRAEIAGPLAPAARATFERLLAEVDEAAYLGPLYGTEKDRFYRELDIFLFPTNYANEAEPLVVYEALREGVYVIACDRGAISEMLRHGAGLVFAGSEIVELAAINIKKLIDDRGALAEVQKLSLSQAQRIRSSSRTELEKLLSRMQGIASAENVAGLV
jgi:glycosyltransferase involved in cell wall biosynthesis